jgi:hypothetical protein
MQKHKVYERQDNMTPPKLNPTVTNTNYNKVNKISKNSKMVMSK